MINREQDDFVGLFGYVAANGNIRELHLTGADISGRKYSGVLVGFNIEPLKTHRPAARYPGRLMSAGS